MSDTTTSDSFVPGGPPAAESGDLDTSSFGVGDDAGDLRKKLLDALESRWNADDPGATTLDDSSSTDTPPAADTAATPAPAPETSPAPSQGQPGETGDGGGRAADDGTGGQGAAASTPAASDDTAQPPASTPAPPADEPFDAGKYLTDYFGTNLTREQAQQVAATIHGLQNLSPQQKMELDRVLAGEAVGQYPATMGVPAQPQQQPTMQQVGQQPDDPATAVLGPRPDDEYLASQWDINARVIRHQAQETEALRGEIARTTQMELERQRQANVEKIDRAVASWRDQYPVLSDAEFDALRARAERSGTFPALVHAHHGDVEQAVSALFDQHFWADDNFRQRAIANLQSGRTPGDHTQVDPTSDVAQQQQQVDAGRQALASSVAGGGGSVTPQSTGVPSDPNKRKQALIQEIAAGHDFT